MTTTVFFREVGTEGELGGQAIAPGVAGTWKDLTDSVNSMAANLHRLMWQNLLPHNGVS
jgi:hypothetical protein